MERQVISKTDYRMMSINTKDINIPNSPQGYQRSRKEKNRIAEIVANFDERIANEPKLSYRDGHYGNSDQSFGMFQYRWTGGRYGTHRAKDYGGHLWRSCSARRRSIFRKGCHKSRSFGCLHGKIHCKEPCKSRTRRPLSGRHFVCHRKSRTSCCFG